MESRMLEWKRLHTLKISAHERLIQYTPLQALWFHSPTVLECSRCTVQLSILMENSSFDGLKCTRTQDIMSYASNLRQQRVIMLTLHESNKATQTLQSSFCHGETISFIQLLLLYIHDGLPIWHGSNS